MSAFLGICKNMFICMDIDCNPKCLLCAADM